MMVDLSPASRLTRKRNMLLQKQLGVQLQILADEYRMTKKDLEKNSRDLGTFLIGLRDRAPGLSSYGQPDTRAMNARNIIHERQAAGTARKKEGEVDVLSKTLKKTKESKQRAENQDSENSENDPSKLPPNRNGNKSEFFNRRIVLDSRRRSFLQHNLTKDGGGGGKPQDARSLGGAVSHAGFLSNRDTQGEARSKPRPKSATVIQSHLSQIPRYGSDAYSERDESMRQQVLGRFDFIFDPQNVNTRGTIRRSTTTSATPLYVPVSSPIPEDYDHATTSATTTTITRPPPPAASSASSGLPPSGYVLNRRVAWSAPPKRREGPSAVSNTSNATNSSAAAIRQTLSVTPRSGTANMVHAHNIRSSSAAGPRSAPFMRDGRGTEMGGASSSINANTAQSDKRGPHRPHTAPPVYQLMQRNVAAPRQQVAGILAEIQSRRADTRAMLMKSRQLKKMVKALAPDEDEDSLSD